MVYYTCVLKLRYKLLLELIKTIFPHLTFFIIHIQRKLEAIKVYVAELSQQHEMLIETMDQMEKEANKKLSFLEGRLTTSLQTAKVLKATYLLTKLSSYLL